MVMMITKVALNMLEDAERLPLRWWRVSKINAECMRRVNVCVCMNKGGGLLQEGKGKGKGKGEGEGKGKGKGREGSCDRRQQPC